MQQRKKWKKEKEHFKIGQIVLIKDDDLPPAKWLLGKIHKLIKGNDNLVRAVEIKTKNRILTRAVQYIVILPVESTDVPSHQFHDDEIHSNVNFMCLEELK